jgi:hypothetical protein
VGRRGKSAWNLQGTTGRHKGFQVLQYDCLREWEVWNGSLLADQVVRNSSSFLENATLQHEHFSLTMLAGPRSWHAYVGALGGFSYHQISLDTPRNFYHPVV